MQGFDQISTVGLITLVLLLICSIIVISIVAERWMFFKRNTIPAEYMHYMISKHLRSGGVEDAKSFSSQIGGMLPRVYDTGLSRFQLSQEMAEGAMSNTISEQRLLMEKNIPVISTIAVIAPFIGLFGTVVGIMETFTSVAEKGQAGIAVVAAGVAEALIATASGLFVAITAVVFFNYYKARISRTLAEMADCATKLSEMMELLKQEKEFPDDLVPYDN